MTFRQVVSLLIHFTVAIVDNRNVFRLPGVVFLLVLALFFSDTTTITYLESLRNVHDGNTVDVDASRTLKKTNDE